MHCLYLFLLLCTAANNYLYSGQQNVVNFLTLAATPKTAELHHPLCKISFGGGKHTSCTLFPNHPGYTVINTAALQDGVQQFQELLTAYCNKDTTEQQEMFHDLATHHYHAILRYQMHVCDHHALSEEKGSGPVLDRIDRELEELDRWVNPYFARLCYERALALADPKTQTPFTNFLQHHIRSKAQQS